MPSPCSCGRIRRGEPYDPAQDCRVCWLALNDVRYQTLFAGRQPTPDAGSSSPHTPCMFRGEDLTFIERESLAVRHDRRWALCLNADHTEYRRPVCPCTGCGTKCKGYIPSAVEAE